MHQKVLSAIVIIMLPVGGTSAATVTYTLDLRTPGFFAITAQTSLGDNGGLYGFHVAFTGEITGLDNRSPYANVFAINNSVGFSNVRSKDVFGVASGGEISGLQFGNTATLYGLGQTSGSFASLGMSPIYPNSLDDTADLAWSAPLVLATGTYSGAPPTFTDNRNFLSADVLEAQSPNTNYILANVNTFVLVPEPCALVVVAFFCLGGFVRIRERHC
jgi:hypothetical protein